MRVFWSLIIAVILLLSALTKSLAESLSVSLRVGDTQISFDGYTSPSALLTFKQDGAVIGTTTADESGNFSKTITLDIDGVQSFSLYASDLTSHTTSTITYSVNLVGSSLTSISNIVLPPTITLSGSTLHGYTNPLSSNTLILSDGKNHTVTPQSTGFWHHNLSTSTSGSYTAYVIATMPGNYISAQSEVISYTITNSSSTPVVISSPSPSPSSRSTVKPKVFASPENSPLSSPLVNQTPQSSPSPRPAAIAQLNTIARSASTPFLLTLIIAFITLSKTLLKHFKFRKNPKSLN